MNACGHALIGEVVEAGSVDFTQPNLKITNYMITHIAATRRGGFRKAQIEYAQKKFGKRWKLGMLNAADVEPDVWAKFVDLREPPKKTKAKNNSEWDSFFKSPPWLKLRAMALAESNNRCSTCGSSPSDHGVVVHVEHIKPPDDFPELALSLNNLEVVCEPCRDGKESMHDIQLVYDALRTQ